MGNNFSNHFLNHRPLETQDFTFYEAACKEDEDVRRFDTNLKARTKKVLSSFGGDSQQSFSFGLLKDVTTSLLDLDRDVLEVILEYEDDVWKNRELFLLVKDFFDNSLATLEFCTATETSIKSAKDSQSFLQISLSLVPVDRIPTDQEVRSILGALDLFCQAENPFGAVFIQKFEAVQKQHTSMLVRLRDKKRELDRQLRHVEIWKKVSSILFGATVAAVLICSVVAAAIAAPPIAGALAAASSLPLGAMGEWVKSLWRGYEEEIRAQREVIQRMHVGTVVAIHDLDNIRLMAIHLEKQLKAIIGGIAFISEHEDVIALRLSIEEITTRRASFVKELEDMQLHVDRVGDRIRQARTIVLQLIAGRSRNQRRHGNS